VLIINEAKNKMIKYIIISVLCMFTFIAKGQEASVEKSTYGIQTGFGIGYRYYFAKSAGYLENESEVAVDLHFRIGYSF
jgi:putative component of toxin-antitoxin plasmid stabilization module